jgi:hypothetical protein
MSTPQPCVMQDLLVMTNLPYFVVALTSFQRGYHIWCMLLLVVFVTSTAYHAHGHGKVLGVCDRCFATIACVCIGSTCLLKSSLLTLAITMVFFVMAFYTFTSTGVDGYSDVQSCLSHSLWHCFSALTALIMVLYV